MHRTKRMMFFFLNKGMMKNIIITLIRPNLEYAKVVWSPNKGKHVNRLGRILRIAAKMAPKLEDLTHEDTRMD